jgi:hypothetical protein
MQNHIEQPRVLTIRDFARALSLQPPTIKAWLLQGRLAKVHLGRRVMIPVSEIDRLINENLVPAANPLHGATVANSKTAA